MLTNWQKTLYFLEVPTYNRIWKIASGNLTQPGDVPVSGGAFRAAEALVLLWYIFQLYWPTPPQAIGKRKG